MKRRTRVKKIFPNREACLPLVSALCQEHSEEWVTGRRYLNMEELKACSSEQNVQQVVTIER
jgi:transposase-like protein